MSVADDIRSRLSALAPQALELTDNSALHAGHAGAAPGGNTHWRLLIVSPAFSGRNTVARHRMVYDALRDLMNRPIHALEIEARAPGEPRT
ncbi:MAG TPA: BolA family protein [Burkholderiales bacterium]|nr:BolA family protein [Burkholderiales bacterium]